MARYGNCVDCKRALRQDEGYHVCRICRGYMCNECASFASICFPCAQREVADIRALARVQGDAPASTSGAGTGAVLKGE